MFTSGVVRPDVGASYKALPLHRAIHVLNKAFLIHDPES